MLHQRPCGRIDSFIGLFDGGDPTHGDRRHDAGAAGWLAASTLYV